jgi:hypothetical protein
MVRIGHGLHIFYSKASSVVSFSWSIVGHRSANVEQSMSDRFKDRHGKNWFVYIALALTFPILS